MEEIYNFLWNVLPLWAGRVSLIVVAFYGTLFYLMREEP